MSKKSFKKIFIFKNNAVGNEIFTVSIIFIFSQDDASHKVPKEKRQNISNGEHEDGIYTSSHRFFIREHCNNKKNLIFISI